MDHLHLRFHRDAEGRGGDPPQCRRVRRCRGRDVPAGRAAGSGRSGPGRPVGRVRRVLRRDVARLALRRMPGACATRPREVGYGPRAVAGATGHHCCLDGAHPGVAVATGGPRSGATADLRRRGLPARAGCPSCRRRPRGVEHLRPHRGDRGGVRRAARRHHAGPHRLAAGRLGSRGGRWRRAARCARRDRRAGDRWSRSGPVSRPGQRCREVLPHGHTRLGPRLPQWRPGAFRTRRPGLHGACRRPGEGRWPADRARRGRQRAAASAGCRWRRRGGAQVRRGQLGPRGLSRVHRSRLRHRTRPRPALRPLARRADPPARPRGRTADPHVGQGRPERTPLAPAVIRRRPDARRPELHRGMGGRALDRGTRGVDHRRRDRLLLRGRRFAGGGTVGHRAA